MITIDNKVAEMFMAQINSGVTKLVDEEFERVMKDLNDRKNEIVAGIAMRISKHISMRTQEERTIIEVSEISKSPNV